MLEMHKARQTPIGSICFAFSLLQLDRVLDGSAKLFIRKKLLAVLGISPTRTMGVSLQENVCVRAFVCVLLGDCEGPARKVHVSSSVTKQSLNGAIKKLGE